MRKFITIIFGLALLTNVTFAQVSDKAVIPVAVTLNSILRLNIVSGGNIEFAFNNLMDYEAGIPNSDAYDTQFTVASSQDWTVSMYVEDDQFIGTSVGDTLGGNHVMPLNNVGYEMTYTGSGDVSNYSLHNGDTPPKGLIAGTQQIVAPDGTSNAGPISLNAFTINWECGTTPGIGTGMNPNTLLEQNLSSDRYTTNVFLILSPL
jgi:hypothetical protein